MHYTCEHPKPRAGEEPVFEIRSLTYRYADGHLALQDINLTIYENDRLALVGHNGAGKTTLVKHLNGLNFPSTGSVHYRGKPLANEQLMQARLEIGILFQDPDDQLFCNTLYDDIAFGPLNQGLSGIEVESRVNGSLAAVGLASVTYKPPHHLSYGQKKRAALASLLAMNPRVLILDEPTANLDPKQEKIFLQLLRRFSGTLICISHDLPFLFSLCSRAVVLENGRIHHDYTMTDLVSSPFYLRDHGLDFTFRFSCCRQDDDHQDNKHEHSLPPQVPQIRIQPRDSIELKNDSKPLIRLRSYSFTYPDGTCGIQDVDLDIPEGTNVALVGENGAGKSTLVCCIMGILRGEGEYYFDGKLLSGPCLKELWHSIGMVFQDPADQLFCPSCWEEVAFGPRQLRLKLHEIEERVTEALSLVRLEGYENRVPHRLSAGERKRLAIASVLSMHPRVLILDEPTANLDPHSEELLLDILSRLTATKILITHDIFMVSRLCDRTVVMHEGRIIRDYPTVEFERDKHLVTINGLDYDYKNACCREIMDLQAKHLAGMAQETAR